MADEMEEELPEESNNVLILLSLLSIFAVCLFYCFRQEQPANDPADDPIGGYLPNPQQPTQSLEERRKGIEDSIISRKVIEGNNNSESETNNSSSRRSNSSSRRNSFLRRLSHSDRTYSSYAMAFSGGFSSRNHRTNIQFSEAPRVLRQSTSLPLLFNDAAANNKLNNHSTTNSQSVRGFTKEEKHSIEESKNIIENEEEEGVLSSVNLEVPSGSDNATSAEGDEPEEEEDTKSSPMIQHRRKADIVARTLSIALRGPQDYDMPTTCDICLMDYEVDEDVAWSHNKDCVHAFHKECIVDWLLRNPKCPLCRNNYIVVVDQKEEDEEEGE